MFQRIASGTKVVAVALAGMLALAGCSGGDNGSTGAEGHSDVTLTFWHYFTDREQVLSELAEQYREETGVTVKLELVPGDTLGQKFQAAAQADNLPDIVASWAPPGETLAPYAVEGKILRLDDTSAMDWFDRFEESTVAGVSFADGNQWDVEAGAYQVPIDVNNMQFLYNKDLFEQAGIEGTPETMDEFIEVCHKLRDAGIQPFVTGMGSWAPDSLAVLYQSSSIGRDKLEQTFQGELSYDSPEWVKALSIFKTWTDEQVWADGILGYDFPAAEALFASGKVAILYDGSWAPSTFKQTNPDFNNYGVFLPPPHGDHPLHILGGVGSSAMVTGTSQHQQEAIDFLKWLTDVPQQRVYAEQSLNIPANKEVVDALPDGDNTRAFAEGMRLIAPPSKYAMPGAVQTTMDKGVQNIVAGSKTPEEVAQLMQQAQETGQEQG